MLCFVGCIIAKSKTCRDRIIKECPVNLTTQEEFVLSNYRDFFLPYIYFEENCTLTF